MDIDAIIEQLQQDFDAIAMPRSAYVLENLVVKPNEHITQQWNQCVLELRVKYYNIKRTKLRIRQTERDIESLTDDIERELKELDIEELNWQMRGYWREFEALYALYQQFPRFTREQLEAGQVEYWFNRLTKQAVQDLQASGRISVGNQEALRQIQVGARTNDKGEIEMVQHLRIDAK